MKLIVAFSGRRCSITRVSLQQIAELTKRHRRSHKQLRYILMVKWVHRMWATRRVGRAATRKHVGDEADIFYEKR